MEETSFLRSTPGRVLILAVVIVLIGSGLHSLWERQTEKKSAEEYAAAIQDIDSKVKRRFGEWKSTTFEDGVAIEWSGAQSELLWIQAVPARVSAALGQIRPQTWVAWAKTQGGQLFTLEFIVVGSPPELMVDSKPSKQSQEDLGKALVAAGRVDLFETLGFKRKPAERRPRMKDPGSTNVPGLFQTIINNIPPHDTYIETHLGGGSIMERKKPASRSIGVDVDAMVIEAWRVVKMAGLQLHHGDAVQFLHSHAWTGREFVYADPPYVRSSRRGGVIYRHEYHDDDHLQLLDVLANLPCAVMVSGYPSGLYDSSILATWRTIDCKAMTHGGAATERIWMNYPEPDQLHDLRYLGESFRERERIKRKKARWKTRLEKLEGTCTAERCT